MDPRRRALIFLPAGMALAGCSGDGDHAPVNPPPPPPPPSPPPPPPPPPVWTIPGQISLVVGQTFDLSPTLPSGIKPGGTFTATLPSCLTLSSAGILTARAVCTISNLQFSYSEP